MKRTCIILTISTALLSSAQTTGSHKTYSGPFGGGTATYSYLTAADGQRIFDGAFKLTSGTPEDGQKIFSGQFANNLQTGTWQYEETISNKWFKNAQTKTVTTINFDKNGVLDGPITQTDHYRNGTKIVRLKANVKKGIPHGSFYCIDLHEDTIRGQYTYGIPTGLWHIPYKATVVDYDTDGHPSAKIVDPETGDITILPAHDLLNETRHFSAYQEWLNPITTELTLRDSKISYCHPQEQEYQWRHDSYIRLESYNVSGDCQTKIPAYTFIWPQGVQPVPTKVNVTLLIEPDGSSQIIDISVPATYQELADQLSTQLHRMKWDTRDNKCRFVGNITFIIVPTINSTNLIGPDTTEETVEDPIIHTTVDEAPTFPGGETEMFKYIYKRLRYPIVASENGIQGTVTVEAVVFKDGSIREVEVVKHVDPNLDKEAIRVVRSLPKFTPGKINGSPVNARISIPISFKII